MTMRPSDRVEADRLWRRLMRLAEFGARADGGVDRQALSDAEIAARAWLVNAGREIGLRPYTDAAANLFLRLEGTEPDQAPVLVGSHIDSQPTGGKFDGAFGVLAALEAAQAIQAGGVPPRRSIEVVAWMNEEGSRFSPGMTGSDLFTGARTLDEIVDLRDSGGVRLGDEIARTLAADQGIPQRPLRRPSAAFVEAHIEQGPLLERAGRPVGVVTGIQGTRRYRVIVRGEAAHAGTAERHERKDALLAAVRMVSAIDLAAAAEPPDVKLTFGLFEVSPNAPSVVPERALFSIDVRHPRDEVVDRLDRAIHVIIAEQSNPCAVELRQIQHTPSIVFNPEIRRMIAEAADALEIGRQDIYSAAGHDARPLSVVCPTGMIFAPCRGGVSHNPAEWAEPADLAAGARVLADTVWRLGTR